MVNVDSVVHIVYQTDISLTSDFCTSAPFKFIVRNTSFYIHPDLVSRHSAPLKCMISGSMIEARNGFARLESVDEGTMKRFVEWAYFGYYTPAGFSRDPSVYQPPASTSAKGKVKKNKWIWSKDIPATPSDQDRMNISGDAMSGWDASPAKSMTWDPPVRRNKRPKTKSELKRAFLGRHYEYAGKSAMPDLPRLNREAYEDYTEVFLSHARVHVFADMYDIQPLRTLAFENLHAMLGCFTLYHQRTGDIIALLRYVITNTKSETDSDAHHLRTLLGEYIAYEMSALMEDEKFNELLVEDGGPLLAHFFKKVAMRIH